MVRSYKSKRKITLKKKRTTKHSHVIKRKLRKSKKKFSKKSQRRYSKKRRVRKLNMQGGAALNKADLKKLLNKAKLEAFEYAKYLLGTKTGELRTKGTIIKKTKYENVFKSGAFPGDPHFSKKKNSSGIGIPSTLTDDKGTQTVLYRSLFDTLPSCSSGSPFVDPTNTKYIDSNGRYKYEFLNEISEKINEISEKINSDKDILGLITLYHLPNLELLQKFIVGNQYTPGCRRINALNYDTNRKDLRKTLTLANQGQFLFTLQLHLTVSNVPFLITICKSNHKELHSIPLILSIDERQETTLTLPEKAISEEAISASFINLSNHPEGNNIPLFAQPGSVKMDATPVPRKNAWSAPGLGTGVAPGPT